MQRLLSILGCFLVLMAACCCNGFGIQPMPLARSTTARPAPTRSLRSSPITLLMAGMAQPETQVKTGVKTVTKEKQKLAQKQQTKADEPVSKRKEEFEDAPMFKLMLLQDDGADVEHVITRLCSIVDDMDQDQAATVFEQAQMAGKAMCGKYPFERAELFKEQLLRSDPMIFADMEEENA